MKQLRRSREVSHQFNFCLISQNKINNLLVHFLYYYLNKHGKLLRRPFPGTF